eukprot:CAMPEP_0118924290 /NCGR_PEP_ID=MMETSP1169-20130426/2494_1 /TAXON_ID=36882 /ORGANISM="Pyramimonas obovata, Strain CCMP722" /LENGTH=453 /DNA_ID=CAMNT_0006865387 /DNA_START=170 /DNA_END=1528 /DNA_ORIENTATION=+
MGRPVSGGLFVFICVGILTESSAGQPVDGDFTSDRAVATSKPDASGFNVDDQKLGQGLGFLTKQIKAAKMYFEMTGNWNQTLDTMASKDEVFVGCSKQEFGYQGCPSTHKISHFLFEKWIPPRKPVTKAEEAGPFEPNDWIFKGHFFNPENLEGRVRHHHGQEIHTKEVSKTLPPNTPFLPALMFLPVLADLVAYIKSRPLTAVPPEVVTLLLPEGVVAEEAWPGAILPRSSFLPPERNSLEDNLVDIPIYTEQDVDDFVYPAPPPPPPLPPSSPPPLGTTLAVAAASVTVVAGQSIPHSVGETNHAIAEGSVGGAVAGSADGASSAVPVPAVAIPGNAAEAGGGVAKPGDPIAVAPPPPAPPPPPPAPPVPPPPSPYPPPYSVVSAAGTVIPKGLGSAQESAPSEAAAGTPEEAKEEDDAPPETGEATGSEEKGAASDAAEDSNEREGGGEG